MSAAISAGNLGRIRLLAADRPALPLADAAQVLAIIAKQEPQNLDRAALRWLGRYVTERAKTLDDAGAALDALAELPMSLPELQRLAG